MIVKPVKCIGCGACIGVCPVEAIDYDKSGKAFINKQKCINCGACKDLCPVEAIFED